MHMRTCVCLCTYSVVSNFPNTYHVPRIVPGCEDTETDFDFKDGGGVVQFSHGVRSVM